MGDEWPKDGPYGLRYKSPCSDPFVGFEEHPSSIDRSSSEAVQEDGNEFHVGELLKFDDRISLQYGGVSGKVIAPDGSVVYEGALSPNVSFRAKQAGTYTAKGPCGTIAQAEVKSGSGNSGEENVGDPSDWVNTSGPDSVDPANHRWIVNADNDEGIAPAPVLRRQGVELGPNGATFRFPNGETVDVGAIEDADEVARHLEGVDAGDVIDADQGAVEEGSNSSSNTPSSGVGVGVGAGSAIGALALAYLLYRRQ